MAKELNRIKTSYEDGTYWVEYETEGGRTGYELVDDINDSIDPKNNKILLEDIPMYHSISELLYSDDILYISMCDYDEEEDFLDMVDLAESTLNEYPELEKYIEIESDEIILYGGLITEVLF